MTFHAKLVIGLLAAAAALGSAAWLVQSQAGEMLERAVDVQRSPAPASDGEPPRLEEYRDVVGALEESIALRGEIDDLLARVEQLTGELRGLQASATEVTGGARDRLEEIGRTLGGARRSARLSGGRLRGLTGLLGATPRLARLIAEELEELDRRFGPSIGAAP